MHRRYTWILLLPLLGLLLLADIFLGSVWLSPATVFQTLFEGYHTDSAAGLIVWEARMPRAVTALCAGMVLPVCGLMMQTFFRNPVAGPDILGVSSGAGLAVAILTMGAGLTGWTATHQVSLILAATAGSVAVLLLMLVIAGKTRDAVTLLIIGLMVGAGVSALSGILQYFSNRDALRSFLLWSFGSLGGVTWTELIILLPAALFVVLLSWLMAKPLNLLLTGEQYAFTMGLSVRRARLLLVFVTGAGAGLVTAYCGPIAFVGIAVPHIARMIWDTAYHRTLVPATAVSGAAVMLLCDIIAQLPGYQTILPVNIITALLGAPFVIWLLVRSRRINNYF